MQFVSKYISTIGVDFGVRSVWIDGIEVKVNFWDLSGHPEFFDVRNEFYKDTQGSLLVFDVGNRRSFEALDNWLKVCCCCCGAESAVFR
jgi:DnaJ family protein C protein 27